MRRRPRYYSDRNQFERFPGFLELISRFEFEFGRCEFFFEGFEFLVCSESAANLLLKLCQQNEMEKHWKIERNPTSDTNGNRRAIWDFVGEIYRDWKASPTPETVSTCVNGILGASCEFWDEDEEEEDGLPIIRVEEQEWFGVIQNQLTMYLQ